MSLGNVIYTQSSNCDHQELGKMPMPSVSYSKVLCSSSHDGIGPAATQAFVSLWHFPLPWKNHVSLQTDIWEALCCGWNTSWRAFEGWITGPNNGLPLRFVPCHVELMMTQAECLFREVKPHWLWSICDVGCWPFAWIWVRSMEGYFYSSTVDPWDLKTVSDFRNGQTVIMKYLYISLNLISTRYCQVPTFGQDTICCFWENCSELKKMTARDFEDLLQVRLL